MRSRATADAARQRRQGFKRRARTAEMVDQSAKRTRADILAANEPQSVDPLFVRQADGLCAVAHIAPKTSSPLIV
jgi:hypothetical protein